LKESKFMKRVTTSLLLAVCLGGMLLLSGCATTEQLKAVEATANSAAATANAAKASADAAMAEAKAGTLQPIVLKRLLTPPRLRLRPPMPSWTTCSTRACRKASNDPALNLA
jgi:hypothetical protein